MENAKRTILSYSLYLNESRFRRLQWAYITNYSFRIIEIFLVMLFLRIVQGEGLFANYTLFVNDFFCFYNVIFKYCFLLHLQSNSRIQQSWRDKNMPLNELCFDEKFVENRWGVNLLLIFKLEVLIRNFNHFCVKL